MDTHEVDTHYCSFPATAGRKVDRGAAADDGGEHVNNIWRKGTVRQYLTNPSAKLCPRLEQLLATANSLRKARELRERLGHCDDGAKIPLVWTKHYAFFFPSHTRLNKVQYPSYNKFYTTLGVPSVAILSKARAQKMVNDIQHKYEHLLLSKRFAPRFTQPLKVPQIDRARGVVFIGADEDYQEDQGSKHFESRPEILQVLGVPRGGQTCGNGHRSMKK